MTNQTNVAMVPSVDYERLLLNAEIAGDAFVSAIEKNGTNAWGKLPLPYSGSAVYVTHRSTGVAVRGVAVYDAIEPFTVTDGIYARRSGIMSNLWRFDILTGRHEFQL